MASSGEAWMSLIDVLKAWAGDGAYVHTADGRKVPLDTLWDEAFANVSLENWSTINGILTDAREAKTYAEVDEILGRQPGETKEVRTAEVDSSPGDSALPRKVTLIHLPHGQYFCGTCGQSMLFDEIREINGILNISYVVARCQGWHCAMKDVPVKVQLERIECDVLEENPRAADRDSGSGT